MKPALRIGVVAIVVLIAGGIDVVAPRSIGVIGEAEAIIGRPMTPVSYAGVARRTAYRGAVATSAAVAATAAAPPPPPPPPPPSQQGAAPAGSVPVGTIVTALPAGCTSAPKGNVEYYLCGGTYYRATFQGNNLVYVVQQP